MEGLNSMTLDELMAQRAMISTAIQEKQRSEFAKKLRTLADLIDGGGDSEELRITFKELTNPRSEARIHVNYGEEEIELHLPGYGCLGTH